VPSSVTTTRAAAPPPSAADVTRHANSRYADDARTRGELSESSTAPLAATKSNVARAKWNAFVRGCDTATDRSNGGASADTSTSCRK